MKKITLLTSGTRGDVQPYIALGLGLQTRGYQVRIAAPTGFARWVEQAGLAFAAVDGNPSDLMLSREGSQALLGGSSIWRSLRASLQFMRDSRPIYKRMLNSAWPACQGSDMLLVGLPSLWGVHIAEALHIPCIGAPVQPLTPTRVWPSAILPTSRTGPAAFNRLTHTLVAQALWQPWRGMINQWRTATLGLNAEPWSGPDLQQMPMLYGFSPLIVPRPSDWPSHHRITGYWRTAADTAWQPTADLQHFLQGPLPLLFFSFGSPGLPDFARHIQKMIAASHSIGAKTMVTLPANEMPVMGGDARHVLFIRDVPHEWLMPQVSAVIHHGGAGTMAAALHAGKPMLILPRAVDQYFWAAQSLRLQIAPTAIPQRQLAGWSKTHLASIFQSLLTHTPFSSNAQVVGENLAREAGVQRALDELQSLGV